MATEPIIPLTEGDMPNDPVETEEGKTQEQGQQPADKSGEQSGKSGETPTISTEQYQKLVEGWREDREELQSEINSLKKDIRNPSRSAEEEAELEGLDEDERVEKLIEIRERKQKQLKSAELKKASSEIRFYERTDSRFAANKQAILKVATEYECSSLKQAILIWNGLEKDKAGKDAAYHDKRKQGADGRSGGSSASGKPEGKPYDPKFDGQKSFGQLFKEGGVR